MSKLKILGRLAAATQLLPIMEGGEELLVGGQAVIEGIMMRSPHSYCISVRKPDGEIVMRRQTIQRPSEKHKFFKWPLLRGLREQLQLLQLWQNLKDSKHLSSSYDASQGVSES